MWAQEWSPRWRLPITRDSVAAYLLIVWLVLIGAYCLAWFAAIAPRLLAVCIALFIGFDTLIVNSAVAFVSRQPVNAWRSAVFGVLAFAQIGTVYGVIYSALRGAFKHEPGWIDPLYFSFVTITTLGYGDIVPKVDSTLAVVLLKVAIIVELMTGLYFLAVILTTIVNWANASHPWEVEPPQLWPPEGQPDSASAE